MHLDQGGSPRFLLLKHEKIFVTELGTVTSFKAKQHVRSGAVPKFQKARPVPFAVKDAIDNEFNWLEAKKMASSESVGTI